MFGQCHETLQCCWQVWLPACRLHIPCPTQPHQLPAGSTPHVPHSLNQPSGSSACLCKTPVCSWLRYFVGCSFSYPLSTQLHYLALDRREKMREREREKERERESTVHEVLASSCRGLDSSRPRLTATTASARPSPSGVATAVLLRTEPLVSNCFCLP